ncbi:hypothetical protein MTR67_045189 [Solanum verrucosum]|uniref:Uncharacterized protein n=1 Tax=Solanum verrucosum TaxID=315347 RepID=A0AAF0UU32_SOLVR|nr:hypothetical protein MTR67_045189 [Solanum verrucosum]
MDEVQCICSHTRAEKLECWEEIVAVRELCGGHWDTCGDFKTVRTIAERRGCNRITNGLATTVLLGWIGSSTQWSGKNFSGALYNKLCLELYLITTLLFYNVKTENRGSLTSNLKTVNQVDNMQGLVDNLGVKWSLPTKYLGMPLGAKNKELEEIKGSMATTWLNGRGENEKNPRDMELWRRFISKKYGLLNNWITEEVPGTFGCSVWKTIRRLWIAFDAKVTIREGNGLKTSFWNEN